MRVLGGSVLALAVAACGPRVSPPPAMDLKPPATAPVLLSEAPVLECYLGVVLASEAVEVVAEVEGRLEKVLVRSGDAVEQGETLAVLDTEAARQQLTIERAMVSRAEAEKQRFALDLDRADQVLRRRRGLGDLISAEEVDAAEYQRNVARSALNVAVAELGQVEARITSLESTLSRSRIRAPFTGVVALRYHDPGTVIASGAPVVRLISSESSLVRFAVPPDQASSVISGRPVRVEVAGSETTVAGTVEHRAPEIDAPSGMVFVEARLDREAVAGLAASGAVARVTVLSPEETPASCFDR